MGLMEKINEIKPYQLNCDRFSIYEYDGVTIQELLCEFFKRINNCIEVSNKTVDLAQWLVDEGLKIEVALKLNEWLIDGTLGKIINEILLKELEEKVNTNADNIDKLKDSVKLLEDKDKKLEESIKVNTQNIKVNSDEIVKIKEKDKLQDATIDKLEKNMLPSFNLETSVLSLREKIDFYRNMANENEKNNIIRIGTFNVVGTRNKNLDITKELRNMIFDNQVSICGLQEFCYDPNFDNERFIKMRGAIENLYPSINFIRMDGQRACNAILSNKVLSNVENTTYTPHENFEKRTYSKGEFYLNGEIVRIYNTHLTYNSVEILQEELQLLANDIARTNIQKIIITADFNSDTESHFTPILNQNFKVAFPFPTRSIDNVLYRGFELVKTETHSPSSSNVSDHNLKIAELRRL